MYQLWHEVFDGMNDATRERAVRLLKKKEGSNPFCRFTYGQLHDAGMYIKEYADLMNVQQLNEYILNKFNDTERMFLDMILNSKCRSDLHRVQAKVRSSLVRTTRNLNWVRDVLAGRVPENPPKRVYKKKRKKFLGVL